MTQFIIYNLKGHMYHIHACKYVAMGMEIPSLDYIILNGYIHFRSYNLNRPGTIKELKKQTINHAMFKISNLKQIPLWQKRYICLYICRATIILKSQSLLVSVSFIQTHGVLSLIFLAIVNAHGNPYVMKIMQPHLDLFVPRPSARSACLARKCQRFFDMFLTNLKHSIFSLNLCSSMLMLAWNDACI